MSDPSNLCQPMDDTDESAVADQDAAAITQPSPRATDPAVMRQLTRYVALVSMVSAAAAVAVVFFELNHSGHDAHGEVPWGLFAVVSILLISIEILTRRSLPIGKTGSRISPTLGFSFSLLLMGGHSATVAIVGLAAITTQVLDRRGPLRIIFNTAQTTLALSLGALILLAFDLHSPAMDEELGVIGWTGISLSAAAVFGSNVILACHPLALLEGSPMIDVIRRALKISISTDAAILLLAPVLVASAQSTFLLLPWLGGATLLMFRTARRAFKSSHEAEHDSLTQLHNRRGFVAEIDLIVDRGDGACAILLMDLDRFKEINDRLGHETGDHVLQAFAARLSEVLPSSAVIARLGGDEFAVILPLADPNEAATAAGDLHRSITQPTKVRGFPLSINTSMGVAVFPKHGTTTDSLLRAADAAMYRAKQSQTGVEVFTYEGASQSHGRIQLLADLATAVEYGDLSLQYQPQVHIATGAIVSVEALVRWNHPQLGLIPPDDFIGLAEQTDLIDPITRMVIERSVADVARLDSDLKLAVNVSARNLQDRHFARDTLQLIDSFGFDPSRLEIELTERSIAQDPHRTVVAFEKLRNAGVSVSVDDFGTGYSTFAMLRDLHVDRIKIDQTLVVDLADSVRDQQIVAAIIDLAHALGSDVVAEGVESEAVWEHLVMAQCDLAQGFLLSKPLPINQLATLIESSPRLSAGGAPFDAAAHSLAAVRAGSDDPTSPSGLAI